MRIALIVNGLTYGGAEVQVCHLARGFRRRGHEVAVFTLLSPEAFADELRDAGIHVADLGMRKGRPNPRAILRLSRVLREFRPDIVHSHQQHANHLARVTRLICPMPALICTAHSIAEGGRSCDIRYRMTDWLADVTTNVSAAAVERYIEAKAAPAHRIRQMPNGADLARWRASALTKEDARRMLHLEEDAFLWAAVGRLEAPKDYPVMLDAFRALTTRHAEARLVIAGAGSLDADLRKLAVMLGVSEQVRFLGALGDPLPLYRAADGYVMSSEREGLPMVLIEAAAAGLPIVSTRVGGTPEVVGSDAMGRLVPVKDAAALADAMTEVMTMATSERERMGAAARAHVQKFDLAAVLTRWEDLYAEVRGGQERVVRAAAQPSII